MSFSIGGEFNHKFPEYILDDSEYLTPESAAGQGAWIWQPAEAERAAQNRIWVPSSGSWTPRVSAWTAVYRIWNTNQTAQQPKNLAQKSWLGAQRSRGKVQGFTL